MLVSNPVFSVLLETVSKVFCAETLFFLPATLLPIKSVVASSAFWIAVFVAVLSASVLHHYHLLLTFFCIYLLKILLVMNNY